MTTFRNVAAALMVKGGLTPEKYIQLLKGDRTMSSTSPSAEKMFSHARVKDAGERYFTEKSVGVHAKTGRPVLTEKGEPALLPSEFENAKAGAFLKRLAQKSGLQVELNEHEQELLSECYRDTWCGKIGGEWHEKIEGSRAKALLDDATSGGIYVTPQWFDENIVTFPLLNGELFPYVDLVEVPRGRRIEGASIGNPTLTWGTGDGSSMVPFDTAALVGQLDTDIFPVTAALEVGRDFLSDSPVNVGAILTANIGQRLAAELDDVIVNGNGTTQPEGLFVATGITTVSKSGGGGTSWLVDDCENLMFSVSKQYRAAMYNPVFLSNDTTYGRVRGIPVGTTDARRVCGMSEGDYTVFDWPHKIENNLANARMMFACLKRYKMYRRQGMSVEWSTQGRTLMLANEALLVCRGRFGGRVVDPSAFAKIIDGKA